VVDTCVIRRRGEVLREAVFEAALAEISERGVRGASMDRIAKRAGTGKAALYRRWTNVRALALDVFITTLTESLPPAPPDSGSLRDDLIASLTTFTSQLDGGLGIVLRELISEAAHDPSLAVEFQTRFGQAKQVEVIGMFQRGMARGEIPVQQMDPYILELPAALTIHQLLLTGTVPSPEQVEHIVDAIMLPLLGAAQLSGAGSGR
jgi:AcrR family transcriptional regulator